MGALTRAYGPAKLALHNAKQTLDALEKKHRKRSTRIHALRVELAQLEKSMAALTEKLEQAKAALHAAKAQYHPLRQQWKQRQAEN